MFLNIEQENINLILKLQSVSSVYYDKIINFLLQNIFLQPYHLFSSIAICLLIRLISFDTDRPQIAALPDTLWARRGCHHEAGLL